MRLLIKGGKVIDPGSLDDIADILVEDGKIAEIRKSSKNKGKKEKKPLQEKVDKTIDASGKIVTPGLIDMHVNLREPGHE